MSGAVHLLLGPPEHGVTLFARQLAEELGDETTSRWDDAARHPRVHLHLNESLLRAAGGLDALERLARSTEVTVTLHDVPQPTDGEAFARRRATYAGVLRVVHGWAVSSDHERRLVEEHLDPPGPGLVAPLPVMAPRHPASTRRPPTARRTAAVMGFVYPGKGHRELVEAAGRLPAATRPAVLALGAPAEGHDDLAEQLHGLAREHDVELHVTGRLSAADKLALLRRVDVGVCGHRNVSASGSTNDWIAAGRRPLVREGRYAREMLARRPGCSTLYDDAGLSAALAGALADPSTTLLAPGTDTRPHLADTAAAYLSWRVGRDSLSGAAS